MRTLALLIALSALVFALPSHANPALHGTWSVTVNDKPLVLVFNPDGTGTANGQAMQWQTFMKLLAIQQSGGQAISYGFDVKDGKLTVGGGDINGTITLTPGTKAAEAGLAKQKAVAAAAPKPGAGAGGNVGGGGNGQELVGKWCKLTNFSGNAGSTSRSECFQLAADGSYTYAYEGSMSVQAGSTASQSGDSGRWSYNGSQLIAQSRSGRTHNYNLEKRNHPKNKGDPMICLNGTCYVTFFNKPAWR